MKKFICFLVIVCVLFLVGYFFWQMFSREKNVDPQVQPVSREDGGGGKESNNDFRIPEFSLDDATKGIKDVYKDDPEFQECASDVVDSCLSRVISQKIRSTGDIALCNDFLTEEARTGCRVTQTIALARDKNDVALCDSIEGVQNNHCKREVITATALNSQSPSACDVLEEKDRERCSDNVVSRLVRETGEAKWCESVPEDRRATCLDDVQRFENEKQEDLRREQEQEADEIRDLDAQKEQQGGQPAQ